MSRREALYQWSQRVHSLFPALKPCQAEALAEYSFGAARSCALTQVVAYLAAVIVVRACTLRQRLRELYQPAAVKRASRAPSSTTRSASARWCAGPHPARPTSGS